MTAGLQDNIKSIRELKNYTQHYMASQLGISQAAYSKIEIGTTDLSFKKLDTIARVLEVSLVSIIEFERQKYFEKETATTTTSFIKTVDDQQSKAVIDKLYQDKINLLEKLLNKTDFELNRYKDKYGIL